VSQFHSCPVRALARTGTAWLPGDCGPLWRVSYGVLRLDTPGRRIPASPSLVQLALPGDLVGMEVLCGQPYRFGVSALTAAQIESVPIPSEEDRVALLQAALVQQQRRSLDMAALRTGPVLERTTQLLRLLGHEDHIGAPGSSVQANAIRATLPRLRELAEVVDAKPETVCRALARLLPSRAGQRGPVAALSSWRVSAGLPPSALFVEPSALAA